MKKKEKNYNINFAKPKSVWVGLETCIENYTFQILVYMYTTAATAEKLPDTTVINMNVISVAEKGAIMGAAVLQIFTLCGLYLVLLLMLLYMCGLFNERSVSRGAAFTAFATGRYFMINDRSMCLEDGAW